MSAIDITYTERQPNSTYTALSEYNWVCPNCSCIIVVFAARGIDLNVWQSVMFICCNCNNRLPKHILHWVKSDTLEPLSPANKLKYLILT